MIKEQIDQDLKQAMLSGNKMAVNTLRGLKSAFQYAGVAKGGDLSEQDLLAVLQKEAKKRQEAADLYNQHGQTDNADKELVEKKMIEKYLPEQLSEDEINQLIDQVVSDLDVIDSKSIGQIIGQVKAKTAGQADGSVIARLVQEKVGK